jgi:hypothetical protein
MVKAKFTMLFKLLKFKSSASTFNLVVGAPIIKFIEKIFYQKRLGGFLKGLPYDSPECTLFFFVGAVIGIAYLLGTAGVFGEFLYYDEFYTESFHKWLFPRGEFPPPDGGPVAGEDDEHFDVYRKEFRSE